MSMKIFIRRWRQCSDLEYTSVHYLAVKSSWNTITYKHTTNRLPASIR